MSAISHESRFPSINNKGFVKPTVAVPLLITLFFVLLTYGNPSFIDEGFETLFVDFRFKLGNIISPPAPPSNVIIVTIDEKSLMKYGRWPWPRQLQAQLIEKVFEDNPLAVAVDIFYPESESLEADSILAETIERHRDKLVMALGFEGEKGKSFTGEMPDILYDHALLNLKNIQYFKALEIYRVLLPPEPIASASRFGHVYALPDMDGKLRWENLYVKFGEEYFPSLSLNTAFTALNIQPQDVKIIGGIRVEAGNIFIPTDLYGRLHIKYYGREGTIKHKSAVDVLSGMIPANTFRNKIVFIGTTAIATYDTKVTPFSANFPGVEKNATVVANILRGEFITRSPVYADMLIVIVVGLITFLIGQRKMNSLSLLANYLVITLLFVLFNQALFTYYGLRFNFIYPLLTLFSEGTFIVNYKYFVEERQARDIKKMFSSYVTERVMNELIKRPEMAKLGGDRRDVTIFFSDIRSFTTFSEKHQPEEVVSILNEYLGAMTDIVFKWEGTLDKFIGDAIVAFWGAPLPQENHTELALGCALDMVRKLNELQEKWRSEGKDSLEVGIGINAGEAIVGNIGAEGKKMDYTVIGDNVNLASRVESLTRRYNASLLLTEYAVDRIRDSIASGKIRGVSIEGVERVIVKGKDEPVGIYKVTSLQPDMMSVITDPEEGNVVKLTEK
ncbi:MAG: adenylate/guanylate cyclase domain-containing protein [Thermodesulfovibrionia bacterium]|nr:adenylate/guanylate cyclase domain-containing protein [Thermodesulfovibrionia bacterium]